MQDTITQRTRELRKRLGGRLIYRYDAAEHGTAHWLDVSRVGAKLLLGRYLRPGRLIELEFESPLRAEDRVCLKARVMWCQQGKDLAEFVAGVHVRRESPETVLAFASLAYQKPDELEAMNTPLFGGVSSSVWPQFHALGSAGLEAAAAVREAV